jgi:hypothetical protein
MNEEDKKEFLKDFENTDLNKKLDMWLYALDQSGIWEDLLSEMSTIAEEQKMKEVVLKMKKTRD